MKTIKTILIILVLPFCGIKANDINDSLVQQKQYFIESKQQIEKMLNDTDSLDFQKAVYLSESPYWNNIISYNVFCKVIDFHATNIQIIAEQNRNEQTQNFKPTLLETEEYKRQSYNNILYNWAIYTYITDTAIFKFNIDSINMLFVHLPYTYTKTDPQALLNWSNSQVINLLHKKEANCNALTLYYKIFAERFHTEAKINVAPGHIYISHEDQKGITHNIELANRAFPRAGTIMTLTHTSLEAVQNGIALRSLDLKQTIAHTIINLAKAYEYKFNTKTDDFLLECANLVLQYDSLSLNAMLLKAEVLEQRLVQTHQSINELEHTSTFLQYQILLTQIYKKGYREMPLEMKNHIISRLFNDTTYISFKDYTPKGFQTISPKDDRYATLSSGMFPEVHENKKLEQFGQTIFNTQTFKIVKFVTADSLYNKYPFDPVVSAWQIDPLAYEFAHMSPYSALGNNPILYIDPDGKKIKAMNALATDAMYSLGDKYGNALKISYDEKNNTFGTDATFGDFKEFKAALKNEKLTSESLLEAWALYQGLKETDVIELTILVEGEENNSTYNTGDESQGSKKEDLGLKTENSEYDKFSKLLGNSTFNSKLSNIFFKGEEYETDEGENKINPNQQGENWVFFNNKNENARSKFKNLNFKVKGHLVINGTNQTSQSNSKTVTNAIKTIFQ